MRQSLSNYCYYQIARLSYPALTLMFLVAVRLPMYAHEPGGREEKARAYYEEGLFLYKDRMYESALDRFRRGLRLMPNQPPLLKMAGDAALRAKKYDDAEYYFESLKREVPEVWHFQASLVQTYQAAGKLKDRNKAREKLFEIREKKRHPDLVRTRLYLCDVIEEDDLRIFALEYFEPEKEGRVFNLILKYKEAVFGKLHVVEYSSVQNKENKSTADEETDEQTRAVDEETSQSKPIVSSDSSTSGSTANGYLLRGTLLPSQPAQTLKIFAARPDYDTLRLAIVELLPQFKAAQREFALTYREEPNSEEQKTTDRAKINDKEMTSSEDSAERASSSPTVVAEKQPADSEKGKVVPIEDPFEGDLPAALREPAK